MENLLPAVIIIGIYIDINYNWNPVLLYILDMELNSPEYIKNSENSDSDKLEM